MNLKTNGWIKPFIIISLILFPFLIGAETIEMHIDQNRFLDEHGNTVYHFNYKIPYNQIAFVEIDEGFLATVDVTISVEDEDGNSTVLNEFAHYIGVRDRETTFSRTQYYLDKIELTLSQEQSGINFLLDFKDRLTDYHFQWSNVLENLSSDSMISDLEFSSRIVKEPPSQGFEKFRRGDYQFYVDPLHIYERAHQDTIFFYYEIQNLFPAVDQFTYITETIRIFNELYDSTITNNIRGQGTTFDMIHQIPADTLGLGYYNIEVSVLDRVTNRQSMVSDYFVVSERIFTTQSLFADLEKEQQLIRYFLPSSRFRNWDNMSNEAKRNFIDRFWTLNDPNPQSERNEFIETVRERVNYANQHYSHFRDGWETDMGRIYIRNGEPTETEKNITDVDTRLTRKEYQIWRYRDLNMIYLFIDIQGNGNFRLIYSRNDDMEHTASNWTRFLGEDFDMSKLE
ncbi:MAG: GWxTD domain-containing protein [Candidatus Cloacimonetes bacterium]|nr:GWxTD domain-containing protein [Candidatus Cloacimonadota bacterium]